MRSELARRGFLATFLFCGLEQGRRRPATVGPFAKMPFRGLALQVIIIRPLPKLYGSFIENRYDKPKIRATADIRRGPPVRSSNLRDRLAPTCPKNPNEPLFAAKTRVRVSRLASVKVRYSFYQSGWRCPTNIPLVQSDEPFSPYRSRRLMDCLGLFY